MAPDQRPDRGAFPPTWAHRVVVIGYAHLSNYRLEALGTIVGPALDDPDARERAVLLELAALVARTRAVIVTFNGRGFDLPVLALRSLCHGVPMAWYYKDRAVRTRYSDEGHLDLCDWLADHGATRLGGLDAIAKLIGLPGKTGVDGSQVDGLYRAGELAAIERYCLGDVVQTALLLLRFHLVQGKLDPVAYRARADELLAKL